MRFNRSEPGMVLSGAAHAALLAIAVIGFSQPSQFADHEESVPVEMVSEAEMRQMTRGERDAKTVDPNAQQKADRVAETNERKQDAPIAQRDVEAPAGPPPSLEKAEAEAAEKKAAEEKARADAEARAKVEAEAKAKAAAVAAVRAAEQAERARQAAAADRARQMAEAKARQEAAEKAEREEEERREAEELRQRKAQEAARQEAAKQAAEAKARREAEAKALKEKLEREQREEEQRKLAEAEKAKKAAEAKRVAEERARKAAEEKAKREAEAKAAAQRQQAENKPFNPTDIQKLLANKQQAQSTGSTGAQIQRQAALGSPTSSAPKLSPSDRESLIGWLQARMRECVSVPPGANRQARPEIRIILARDGSLAAPPALVGGDRAVGEAAVRGIRACAPYRIPDRFAVHYEDWRSLLVTIDASDL